MGRGQDGQGIRVSRGWGEQMSGWEGTRAGQGKEDAGVSRGRGVQGSWQEAGINGQDAGAGRVPKWAETRAGRGQHRQEAVAGRNQISPPHVWPPQPSMLPTQVCWSCASSVAVRL